MGHMVNASVCLWNQERTLELSLSGLKCHRGLGCHGSATLFVPLRVQRVAKVSGEGERAREFLSLSHSPSGLWSLPHVSPAAQQDGKSQTVIFLSFLRACLQTPCTYQQLWYLSSCYCWIQIFLFTLKDSTHRHINPVHYEKSINNAYNRYYIHIKFIDNTYETQWDSPTLCPLQAPPLLHIQYSSSLLTLGPEELDFVHLV